MIAQQMDSSTISRKIDPPKFGGLWRGLAVLPSLVVPPSKNSIAFFAPVVETEYQ